MGKLPCILKYPKIDGDGDVINLDGKSLLFSFPDSILEREINERKIK